MKYWQMKIFSLHLHCLTIYFSQYFKQILPLRQLRVEYKPFEARGKLSKLYDVVLVDKRVLKFVPRYLGKSFYQSGR